MTRWLLLQISLVELEVERLQLPLKSEKVNNYLLIINVLIITIIESFQLLVAAASHVLKDEEFDLPCKKPLRLDCVQIGF